MTESNPSISSRRFDDILGTHVTQDDLNIPCHKLPTKMEVLRAYLAEFSVKRANKQLPDRREAATNVATKIKEIYGRAHIPTIQDNTIVYHIEKVYQDYRDICKVKTTNKTRPDKIENWRARNSSILPVHGDSSSLLEEDAIFLEDQKTARLLTMGGKDVNLDRKIKRKEFRDQEEQDRQKR